MEIVNLVFGRFMPFTKGHYKCVEEAWKAKGIPTVICMIRVPEDKVDEKHPFPSAMIVDLYKDILLKDPKIVTVIDVPRADPVLVHQQLGDKYQIASLTCGTDRFAAYQWMYKYKEQADLADDFEILEVKRSDEDISATKARKALLDDDRMEFLKLIPMIPLSTKSENDIFAILREQILKVVK